MWFCKWCELPGFILKFLLFIECICIHTSHIYRRQHLQRRFALRVCRLFYLSQRWANCNQELFYTAFYRHHLTPQSNTEMIHILEETSTSIIIILLVTIIIIMNNNELLQFVLILTGSWLQKITRLGSKYILTCSNK